MSRPNIQTSTVGSADTTGYDIVLLLGQSNMSGRGTPYDSRLDPPDSRVWEYGSTGTSNTYAGVVSQAVEPLVMHDTPSGIGPGLVFARWYASSISLTRRVLLVPAAHGGTPLVSTATLGWQYGISGNLYAQSLTQTQSAISAAGSNSKVVAALWVQGETDGDSSTSGASYQTNLDALINGLRSDLSLPNLPFVIGGMVPDFLGTGTRSAINTVHQTAATRLTRVAFSQGPAGMSMNDGNHYNASGQRINGRRMFDAYRRIINGVADPTYPAAPGIVTGVSTSNVTTTTLTVSWTAVSGADSYYVRQKLSSGSTWTLIATQTATTFAVTGLANATSYDFQVIALNAAGQGAASATATATTGTASTVPGQVVGVTASSSASSTMAIAWTATATATSYLVEYKLTSGSTWGTVTTTASTSATASGLTASTSYDFRVTASNGVGSGTVSATVTSSTLAAGAAVSDTFTRSDSSTTLGSADTGQAWTALAGTWGVLTNTAYCITSPGTGPGALAVIDAGLSDGSATVTFAATNASINARLIFRLTDGNNFWMLQYRGSTGKYQLYKYVAAAFTQIGTDFTNTAAVGDVIRAEFVGSAITIKINNVTAATTTDTFNSTATKHGIGNSAASTTVKYDNFSISA